jgi:ADP-ribose pyrophosphatase YjhB (NUDIX family)
MPKTTERIVVGAVIINDEGILLVRERWSRFWTFPGGTLEAVDGSYEDCLAREIGEELPDLRFQQHNFRLLGGMFPGQVPRGGRIQLKVYRVPRAGKKIKPGREIKEARFVADPESLKLAEATRRAIAALRRDGYL